MSSRHEVPVGVLLDLTEEVALMEEVFNLMPTLVFPMDLTCMNLTTRQAVLVGLLAVSVELVKGAPWSARRL